MKINFEPILTAVVMAENKWGLKNGEQKREFAIEVLVGVINLPFPFSLFERKIIGWFVDLTVFIFNKLFTNRWRSKKIVNIIGVKGE